MHHEVGTSHKSTKIKNISISGAVANLTFLNRSVSTLSDATITCRIEGIYQQQNVIWEDPEGNPVNDQDAANYVPLNGTLQKGSPNYQEATLTITVLKLSQLTTSATFTCKLKTGESEMMTLTKLIYGETLPYTGVKYKSFHVEYYIISKDCYN